jgi:hypothetical protein
VLDQVVGLNAVLNEEVVTSDPIADIVLDCQVVHAVDGGDSGERVVDCISSNVGGGDISGHMEVDAVSSHDLRLAAVRELSVGDLSSKVAVILAGQQQMGAVHFGNRIAVAHHLDVSGQESHLSSHFQLIATVTFNH